MIAWENSTSRTQDLEMNVAKTERTTLKRERDEKIDEEKINNLTNNKEKAKERTKEQKRVKNERINKEEWRKTKKLGTLLGEHQEVKRRKQLASVALNNMKSIWKINNKIGVKRKVRLYKTYIYSILTYNMGTWALNKDEIKELEVFQRKTLRRILGISYLDEDYKNDKLYKKCEITITIKQDMRIDR